MFQGQKWHGGSVNAKVKDNLSFSLYWAGSNEMCWHVSWQLCGSQIRTVVDMIPEETRNVFIHLKEHPAFAAGGQGILCIAASVKLGWLEVLLLKASPRSQGRTILQCCRLSVPSVMPLILIEGTVGLILVLWLIVPEVYPSGSVLWLCLLCEIPVCPCVPLLQGCCFLLR